MSFNNKVVIVTGASSGIGAVTAVQFAEEGADVAIVARTQAKLEAVAKKIEALGKKPLIIKADLSKEAEAATVVSKTVEHFGKLDILVNNAGFYVEGSLLDGKALEAYDKVMDLNMRAVIHLTMLAAPHLVKTKGNVINISSGAADSVSQYAPFMPYHVSKAALNHFSRCAALELAASGVRVNAVSPGPVDNEFMHNNGFQNREQLKEMLANNSVLGYIATNEEIAGVILFLVSDKAKSVTGSKYDVDCGYHLKN